MTGKTATLYRMVMDKHVCPYGLKSKHLLEREGFTVDDRHLTTRDETDAFKAEHDVETTPQTFIGGKRIGGHDDLREYFDKPAADPDATSYKPVIAIFAVAALMALSIGWAITGAPLTVRTGELFIAFSMCLLAVQNCRTCAVSRPCSWATTYWRSAGCPMPTSIPLPRRWPGF